MKPPDSFTPNHILVIKSRHLGDVLLTGPLLSTLKLWFPNALITVLVKAETAPMLAGHPHIHELICFPRRNPKHSALTFYWHALLWWLALRKRHFDWALNTTEGDRGIIASFIAGAPIRISFLKFGKHYWWRKRLLTQGVQRQSGQRHAVIRNLDLLATHAQTTTPSHTRVYSTFSQQDTQAVKRALHAQGWDGQKPLVQIHPVARWKFKCWTEQGMAEIINHLHQQGFAVGITSSQDPIELQKVSAILALCHHQPINLSGQLSIPQVMAFTAHCRLFFGVDTAMMHIAASLDVPVVALFGPSMAFEWGPWPNDWPADKATPYPNKNGIQICGPHLVIQQAWHCVPCGQDGCRGSKRSDCLLMLESQAVIPLLDRFLANIPQPL